jgi:hypothetical protein
MPPLEFDPEKHCGSMRGADKRDGRPCTKPKGWGTDHKGYGTCKLHLGTTANHRRHAQAEQAEDDVRRLGLTLAETEGHHQRLDPREVLSIELLRSHRVVVALEQLVQGLEQDELHGPLYNSEGGLTGRALPHVLVVMYEEERKHLLAVAAAAARAGVEERRVQLEQEKGALIASIIRATVDAIKGLTAVQRQQALEAAAKALRALPGGSE